MTSKAESQESSLVDTLKLGLAVVLVIASIAGFYHFEDESLLYRVLGLLGVVLLAVGVAYTTSQGKRLSLFMVNARTEVRKMVWPTRAETLQTTLMILLIVLILAIFLWLVDMLLGWGVGALLNNR
ncbi:MAG TPA: preprotein translocase subunit SecE [Thiothrix sp.]|nr:preprotein translocase subunit SecE [Thiothrix sp.]